MSYNRPDPYREPLLKLAISIPVPTIPDLSKLQGTAIGKAVKIAYYTGLLHGARVQIKKQRRAAIARERSDAVQRR